MIIFPLVNPLIVAAYVVDSRLALEILGRSRCYNSYNDNSHCYKGKTRYLHPEYSCRGAFRLFWLIGIIIKYHSHNRYRVIVHDALTRDARELRSG